MEVKMSTKIRSRWVSGLLQFINAATGNPVLKINESGIEANVTGSQTGAILGSLALTKADNYALSDAEKANLVFLLTASAGSKTFTLGLAPGQVAFVINAGSTNAFTVKNVSGDTGTSLAAGKTLLIVASSTANASIVKALD
jgi:hypothetical protein